jgi:hypothetical protein
MIKNLLVSLVLLFSIGLVAQNGTPSIYSFYGIGDITFKGALENRMMGGVSVFTDSIHINLQNPAAFASLKFTSLTISGSNKRTNFETNTAKNDATRSSIDYFAVGLPLGKKFGGGFGLMPFSSVGYKIQSLAQTETESSERYTGTGGLNKVFLAFGYQLTPKLSVGLDLNYNFGEISTTGIVFLPDTQFGSRELNTSNMSGLIFNSGLMFQSRLKNKMDVFASLVFTPESQLKLSNERNIATILYSNQSGEVVVDDQDIPVSDVTIKMPTRLSIGGGIGVVRKWLLGTEITFKNSSNFGSRFTDIQNVSYENSQKYSVGGYFIPNYNSFSSYFKRVTYRGGLRYETTGLVVNNKSIEDMALTFGFGLPLRGTFSNINFGFEFGKRGTKAAGLVQENYRSLSISLSLNDKWFVKRKYD